MIAALLPKTAVPAAVPASPRRRPPQRRPAPASPAPARAETLPPVTSSADRAAPAPPRRHSVSAGSAPAGAAPAPGVGAAVPYAIGGPDPEAVLPDLPGGLERQGARVRHRRGCRRRGGGVVAGQTQGPAQDVRSRSTNANTPTPTWTTSPSPTTPRPRSRGRARVRPTRGAGAMGFTGAATKSETEQATGLTELAGDSFGGGPTEPMLPGDWDQEGGTRD